MSKYKKIAVALDIYLEYDKVLTSALELAGRDTEVDLLYIVSSLAFTDFYTGASISNRELDIITPAKNRMELIGANHNIPQSHQHIMIGKPATEIHEFSEKNEVDLIVIGTHGQKGLQLLLGTTANSILHGTPCDVLAIRI